MPGPNAIHTMKAHRMAEAIKRAGKSESSAWAITQSKLGKAAIKKSHRRHPWAPD